MADKKAPVKKAAEKVAVKAENTSFAFGKENYILMVVGLIVIIIGFALMGGKEDIFNSTKLTVAPIVVILGFLIEVIAIMRKSKD
jgi:hypothetical protein